MPKPIVIKAERIYFEDRRCLKIIGCYNVAPENELPEDYLKGLAVFRWNSFPPGLAICQNMDPIKVITPGMILEELEFLDVLGKINIAGDRLHRVNKLKFDAQKPWKGIEVIKI
jgi:hypothetical protein